MKWFRGDTQAPSGLPAVLLVMDDVAHNRFHIRIETGGGSVETIPLSEEIITPVHARQEARDRGYEPLYWMRASSSEVVPFF